MTKNEYIALNGSLDGWSYDKYGRKALTKEQRIQIYGEDEYELYVKKQSERNRKWRYNNPEKAKEFDKHNNKDILISTKGIEIYEKKKKREIKRYYDNKDEILKRNKEYRTENHEHYIEIQRKWRCANKEKLKQYEVNKKERKKYYNIDEKRRRASSLKGNYTSNDKKKGYKTDLTIDSIIELWNDGCYYCGETDWHKLGADRIDNTKGHTIDNCICSCERCNKQRGNMPFRMFSFLKQHPNIKDDEYEIIIKRSA